MQVSLNNSRFDIERQFHNAKLLLPLDIVTKFLKRRRSVKKRSHRASNQERI